MIWKLKTKKLFFSLSSLALGSFIVVPSVLLTSCSNSSDIGFTISIANNLINFLNEKCALNGTKTIAEAQTIFDKENNAIATILENGFVGSDIKDVVVTDSKTITINIVNKKLIVNSDGFYTLDAKIQSKITTTSNSIIINALNDKTFFYSQTLTETKLPSKVAKSPDYNSFKVLVDNLETSANPFVYEQSGAITKLQKSSDPTNYDFLLTGDCTLLSATKNKIRIQWKKDLLAKTLFDLTDTGFTDAAIFEFVGKASSQGGFFQIFEPSDANGVLSYIQTGSTLIGNDSQGTKYADLLFKITEPGKKEQNVKIKLSFTVNPKAV